MRKLSHLVIAIVLLALPTTGWTQPSSAERSKAALTVLDLRQKELVARADVDGLAQLAAPGLTINAPTGRVLTRDQFLAMMRSGQIGAENFTRNVERVSIFGEIGVVMGRELFTPSIKSELGREYGAVPLQRRYTNVYVRDHGRWRWFARHANVVSKR